jgi:hypothetical protein
MSVESWKAVFDWAAVVLVGLTFIAGAGALIAGKVINERQASELKQFQLDLEKTREGAASASERAAQADLKRVELENRIVHIFGPRQLTTEQSARITQRLKGLKDVKIDVFTFALGNPYTPTETQDSLNIARTLVNTLRSAHIDAEGWILESCSGVSASNLVVSVTGKSSDDRKIASRLIDAFRPELGTYPEIGDSHPYCTKFSDLDKSRLNKRMHDASISITIGRKINPLLALEMLEPNDEQKEP